MPSFDVVSEVDLAEFTNAVNQARKEITNRYDFRGTGTTVEQNGALLTVTTESKNKLEACHEIIRAKATRRGVPVANMSYGKPESASGNQVRQAITLLEGIDRDQARRVVKTIKDGGFKKVQASIQGETVRVTAPKRDTLQQVITLLKCEDFGIALQYKNFRQ